LQCSFRTIAVVAAAAGMGGIWRDKSVS